MICEDCIKYKMIIETLKTRLKMAIQKSKDQSIGYEYGIKTQKRVLKGIENLEKQSQDGSLYNE